MIYSSVCSGIEAPHVAWNGLGITPAWFSEIDKFPCEVLAHRYPTIPNTGDMTLLPEKILSGEVVAPDILIGGTPCQSFSVAGLKGSLDDPRGNLTLVLVRILEAIDVVRLSEGKEPCILVWENVPGVLSTKDNAFGCFLGALSGSETQLKFSGKRWSNAGCVFGKTRSIAWRTLDAQYFGVPQRRRRVFLVASAGGISPEQILFEHEGKGRDIKESQNEREDPTSFIEGGFGEYKQSKIGATLRASGGAIQGGSETLVVNGRQNQCVSDKAFTLDNQSAGNTNVLCVNANIIDKTENSGGNGLGVSDIGYTLTCQDRHAVCVNSEIRRLTPKECERLQGFPDNHTLIPWRGKPAELCPDSLRYKAIGNSMAVPVVRWIGERILVNSL